MTLTAINSRRTGLKYRPRMAKKLPSDLSVFNVGLCRVFFSFLFLSFFFFSPQTIFSRRSGARLSIRTKVSKYIAGSKYIALDLLMFRSHFERTEVTESIILGRDGCTFHAFNNIYRQIIFPKAKSWRPTILITSKHNTVFIDESIGLRRSPETY